MSIVLGSNNIINDYGWSYIIVYFDNEDRENYYAVETYEVAERLFKKLKEKYGNSVKLYQQMRFKI